MNINLEKKHLSNNHKTKTINISSETISTPFGKIPSRNMPKASHKKAFLHKILNSTIRVKKAFSTRKNYKNKMHNKNQKCKFHIAPLYPTFRNHSRSSLLNKGQTFSKDCTQMHNK